MLGKPHDKSAEKGDGLDEGLELGDRSRKGKNEEGNTDYLRRRLIPDVRKKMKVISG